MLSLCLRNTRNAASIPHHTKTEGRRRRKRSTGIAAAPLKDPREEYLVRATTKIQVRKQSKATCQERKKSTPRVVATPLPPRNRKKHDQSCPATTRKAARRKSGEVPKNRKARYAPRKPFSASPTPARRAGKKPATRETFVAPMLPLPYCRRSTPLRTQVMMSPQGNDPRR